ncbi:MAG: hypothetical protein KME60_07065 [Cyanomargarita calcarea GSE-NOS-MK-12-04C]|uniref:Uncharacterized protein n=1 Tax=Cyanomargarita calcarea GSE-NOS-MK-12-04C TaxID=2839659 RepID=A0A951QIZ3_9CYAN|nr:hypothetical protein [Cyanomargarita calcarea GSE-NOS-MK-12-04C]
MKNKNYIPKPKVEESNLYSLRCTPVFQTRRPHSSTFQTSEVEFNHHIQLSDYRTARTRPHSL